MTQDHDIPQLPEEIVLDDLPEPGSQGISLPNVIPVPDRLPGIEPLFPPWRFHSLRHGAYFLQWRPKNSAFSHFNGTMRIERHAAGTTASGDLYTHNRFRHEFFPTFRIVPNPDPSPSAGIPIFRRNGYHCYLRVTQILEKISFSNTFTMKFEKFDFDSSTNTWSNKGLHSASMKFSSAPSQYPSGATYLKGNLKSPVGVDLGTISMGWVSKYLREATVEIDRVSQSEYPADNGSGLTWKKAFKAVDWNVTAYESDTNVAEPSGQGWSDAEMHSAMLTRRDSTNLDTEWRYHVLAVRQLDSTSRGIMYDAYAGDSNNIPREGVGLSSHWRIPNTNTWGTVRGQRFGAAAAPYFRTAVHELGHALGLYHNTADNGFMNTTGTIAASAGTFPSNIQWAFNAADAKRLRHMPDPWVRPGMIPFGSAYNSAPISPTDALDLDGPLSVTVEPLLDAVPIGAPVRVKVTLTNNSDSPIEVPDCVSLKSEHVTGKVINPANSHRSYRSIMRCVEEHDLLVLKPGKSTSEDMTLLRGLEGALFPAPGLHTIEVNIGWEVDGVGLRVGGSTNVMITPPVNESHASAAKIALSEPDLLLTLAIGGDHLAEGNAALDVAMTDDTLAPHFAVIKAKSIGRRFGQRKASPTKAIKALGSDPVFSNSEAERMAEIASDASIAELKKMPKKLISSLKSDANGSKFVKKIVDGMSA